MVKQCIMGKKQVNMAENKNETLKKAREEYESIFGYDPNGEMELEFNEQDEYLAVLLQCIEEKKDMFDVLGGEEA